MAPGSWGYPEFWVQGSQGLHKHWFISPERNDLIIVLKPTRFYLKKRESFLIPQSTKQKEFGINSSRRDFLSRI
jgi:hypothetical protein